MSYVGEIRERHVVTSLTTRRWSVQEWLRSEAACDHLLARSGADALFRSWQWLTLWWQHYAANLGLTAEILAFYRVDALVGLAPLYHRSVVRGGLVPARSVQFIGLSWRDPAALISEYLDVIAVREDAEAVRNECLRILLERPAWTELVIGFTAAGETWRDAFARLTPERGHYARETDRSVSYLADLSQGFAAYLASLGQSTRRSVWNLRRRLIEEHGEVRLELIGHDEIDSAFSDLNRLHQLRWNRPAFPPGRLEFHKRFAADLAARGELVMTRLRVAGSVVSVLYDIRKGTRQYNMKMGFDPAFTSRLSLGLVHFGYAMEAAAECGVALYDFLAGPGQKADFKRNLGQVRRELGCVQMVRGRWLPALYRWRDRIRPGTATSP
jgi:CelD/BcsL family acetyltransferase involved in cellulose biosynthesis